MLSMSSSSCLRRSSREIRHYYQSVARRIRTPGQPWHPPAQREWSRIEFASSCAFSVADSFHDASNKGRWLLRESNVSEFGAFGKPSFVFHARKSLCHGCVRQMAIVVIVFHPICYGLTFPMGSVSHSRTCLDSRRWADKQTPVICKFAGRVSAL